MKNKVLIFDCDGTVLDTFQLIEECTRQTFATILPHVNVTTEEIHSFFGPLLDESFKKYTKNESELNACIETYRRLTMELHPQYVKAYPGIKELITNLKQQGYKLAIVSNKISEAIIYGLVLNKLEKSFDLIVGAEKMKKPKPDPDGVYQVLEYFNVNKTLLIGDTKFDIECGKNATNSLFDVKTVGVTWCKATRKDFTEWGADYIIDTPQELEKILEDNHDI